MFLSPSNIHDAIRHLLASTRRTVLHNEMNEDGDDGDEDDSSEGRALGDGITKKSQKKVQKSRHLVRLLIQCNAASRKKKKGGGE